MPRPERIVKTFYDALEERKILGRKCTSCGHVEFPPYLACNACGNLDTEWCEISGKALATQFIAVPMAFSEPAVAEMLGDYVVATVQPEDSDEYNTCVVGVRPEQVDELNARLPIPVKPAIVQQDGYKMAFWRLDEQG
jgi:uncharacterized OB-fold protein